MRCQCLLIPLIALTGCTQIGTWRLVTRESSQILVPPDVKSPNITQRTLSLRLSSSDGPCPGNTGVIALQRNGSRTTMKIPAGELAKQPRGWLANWTSDLEQQRCISPQDAALLALRASQSVPLAPNAAFELLNPDDRLTGIVDLHPGMRLQVVSPIGGSVMAGQPTRIIPGSGYNLTIEGKASESLRGYETALYAIQPNSIEPLYADRNIQGRVQRTAQPAHNPFQLPADTAFFRIIYKSWQNGYTAMLIPARTHAELDRQTHLLESSGACEACVPIPRSVAVHPLIAVTVNGAEVLLPRAATVAQAVRRAGIEKPDKTQPRLYVSRNWNGKLVPVTADSQDALRKLILHGGETIAWK